MVRICGVSETKCGLVIYVKTAKHLPIVNKVFSFKFKRLIPHQNNPSVNDGFTINHVIVALTCLVLVCSLLSGKFTAINIAHIQTLH